MPDASNPIVALPPDWTSRAGPAAGTAGLEGGVRLRFGETDVGILQVADGTVALTQDGGADVTLTADSDETLVRLLGGDLSPVVARLQDRAVVEGDAAFALRVFLGLRAGSPWRGLAVRR